MIRYEDDDTAIARALNALGEGEIIDHGTARAIASQYNDYRTAHFVNTGYIPQGAQWLMSAIRRGVSPADLKQGADALNALTAYLVSREESHDTGRVPGWSDMWVPKHVDYPHQDGALDTCWCFDGDDQCEECGWEARNCACGDAGTGHGAYEYRSGH
jgi:hypothetical protein